ncbi:MAG: trypsin-like peptidase domain-containing protein [bacterium]
MRTISLLLGIGFVCMPMLGTLAQEKSKSREGAKTQNISDQDIPDEIVKKVDPAVVCIMHEGACGSGFVISKDGYIISNGHVVQGTDSEEPLTPAKLITVITSDEKKYRAKVIGFCMNPDVSLLKIEAESEMSPVEFGDSTSVKVGEKCFAVGAPLGLKRTFTSGILSSIDRTDLGTATKVFQTDAAINPGNSGGPLFDQSGRVLGINTYGMNQANNLGFTIPAHVIQVLMDHFLKHGRFIRSDLPVIMMGEIYDEMAKALKIDKGLIVEYVMPGTAAEKAGFKTGDIITGINGKPCSARTKAEMLDIDWGLTIKEPGTKLVFEVKRGSPSAYKNLSIVMNTEESEPIPETNFPGEIVTYRNDTLGVGYKQLVKVQRILYGLEQETGVILDVREPEKNGVFDKAELRNFDIVTKVAGKTVIDPASFWQELKTCLLRKDRYIDITACRRKTEITTTLAPFYELKGMKVAVVLPSGKSEYLDLTLRELLSDGADITIVSASNKNPDICKDSLFPITTLQEIKGSNFNAVVFMDSLASKSLCNNADALRVVKEAYSAERVLAAIGASSLVLPAGEAEILKKKITTSEDVSSELINKKATYTGSKIEKDDTIITTTGFDKETVRSFLKSLRQATKGTDLIEQPAKK